jgi:hypothetical protein
MSLTALQIRAFSPGATAYKRADERGLYLEIVRIGAKSGARSSFVNQCLGVT